MKNGVPTLDFLPDLALFKKGELSFDAFDFKKLNRNQVHQIAVVLAGEVERLKASKDEISIANAGMVTKIQDLSAKVKDLEEENQELLRQSKLDGDNLEKIRTSLMSIERNAQELWDKNREHKTALDTERARLLQLTSLVYKLSKAPKDGDRDVVLMDAARQTKVSLDGSSNQFQDLFRILLGVLTS